MPHEDSQRYGNPWGCGHAAWGFERRPLPFDFSCVPWTIFPLLFCFYMGVFSWCNESLEFWYLGLASVCLIQQMLAIFSIPEASRLKGWQCLLASFKWLVLDLVETQRFDPYVLITPPPSWDLSCGPMEVFYSGSRRFCQWIVIFPKIFGWRVGISCRHVLYFLWLDPEHVDLFILIDENALFTLQGRSCGAKL